MVLVEFNQTPISNYMMTKFSARSELLQIFDQVGNHNCWLQIEKYHINRFLFKVRLKSEFMNNDLSKDFHIKYVPKEKYCIIHMIISMYFID